MDNLFEPVRNGDVGKVRLRIRENNSLVNEVDAENWTPLHWAVRTGNLEICEILLKNDADTELEDAHGWTPLFYAVKSGREDLCVLIGQKARLSHVDGSKMSVFHHLAGQGEISIFQSLHAIAVKRIGLDAANKLIVLKDINGWVPLTHSVVNGKEAMTKILLMMNCSVETRDEEECTLLHHAAGKGEVYLVKILTDAGSDVNVQDKDGCTPLRYACMFGREDAVEFLLDSGADPNIANNSGITPFMACINEDTKTSFRAAMERKEEREKEEEEERRKIQAESKKKAPKHRKEPGKAFVAGYM